MFVILAVVVVFGRSGSFLYVFFVSGHELRPSGSFMNCLCSDPVGRDTRVVMMDSPNTKKVHFWLSQENI